MNEMQPATRPTAWRITHSMVWFALGANLLLFGLRTDVDTSWDTASQCMLAALLAFVLAAVALVGRFEALWTLPIAAGTLGCLWALWTYPEWGDSTQVLFVLVMSGVAVGGLGGGLQRPNLLPHTTTLVPIVRQAIRSL